MPDKIHLEIVSAEEQLFSSDVEMVFAPAEMGEVGISPKHTPLITRLKPGDVRAQINKDQIEKKIEHYQNTIQNESNDFINKLNLYNDEINKRIEAIRTKYDISTI